MRFYSFIAFLLISISFISCNKNGDNSVSGDAVLSFTVSDEPLPFIQTASFSSDEQTMINTGSLLLESKSMPSGMVIDSYMEENDLSKQNPLATANHFFEQNAENIKQASNRSMQNNVKYRILLYYKKDNTFAASVEATAGKELLIPVNKNEQYLWYAYSYNNENSISDPSDKENPTIETPTQSELLYDRGEASSPGGNTPFIIRFKHQLTKVTVEFDVQNYYGKIVEEKANVHFSEDNYINQGTFSIRGGNISDIKNSGITKLYNFKRASNHPYVARTHYYTADPQHLKTLKLRIDQIFLIEDDGGKEVTLFPKSVHLEFTGYNPAKGKEILARMRLWKRNTRKLTILHAQGQVMNITKVKNGGHAAGAGASHNFLKNAKAFGLDDDSKVKIDGFDHLYAYEGNNALRAHLASNPDIVILGEEYRLSNTEANELTEYVNKGGVFLMFSDAIYSYFSEGQLTFIRKILGSSTTYNISSKGPAYQGYVYIVNTQDEVMNGPFGDTRKSNWGADLARNIALKIPGDQVHQYSTENRVSKTTGSAFKGTTMFRHKTLNWFWVGDGGFLANPEPNGVPKHLNSNDPASGFLVFNHERHLPFATTNQNMPTVYQYGNPRKVDTHNSIIFGNIMSWAVDRALNNGINSNK